MANMTLAHNITVEQKHIADMQEDPAVLSFGNLADYFENVGIDVTRDGDTGDLVVTDIEPDIVDSEDGLSPLMTWATYGSYALFYEEQGGGTVLVVRERIGIHWVYDGTLAGYLRTAFNVRESAKLLSESANELAKKLGLE